MLDTLTRHSAPGWESSIVDPVFFGKLLPLLPSAVLVTMNYYRGTKYLPNCPLFIVSGDTTKLSSEFESIPIFSPDTFVQKQRVQRYDGSFHFFQRLHDRYPRSVFLERNFRALSDVSNEFLSKWV